MSDKNTVVITGVSVMCANGNNAQEFYQNLFDGKGGIRVTNLFPTDKLRTSYFGQIDCDYIYEVSSLEQKTRTESIIENLIMQLFDDAEVSPQFLQTEKTAFSFATSVGTNDYITAHQKNTIPDSICKSNLYKFAKKLGVNGPIFVNTSACSAGTAAIGIGKSLIDAQICDMAIVGGADPLTEFSAYGFHALQSLSGSPCRPFDKNRDGITIGEGGALLMLETLEHAKARNAKIYAELLGYGLGNDAYHPTSPDPTGLGAYRVMAQAAEEGNVPIEKVEYINAHGTGTVINDDMEIKSFEKLKTDVMVSSTKSYTGHCLAGAGAIEAVAAVLTVYHNQVFATINSNQETPIEHSTSISLIMNETRNVTVNYALSNSFAFGGSDASILLGKCTE